VNQKEDKYREKNKLQASRKDDYDDEDKIVLPHVFVNQGCQFGSILEPNSSFYVLQMSIWLLKLFQTGNPVVNEFEHRRIEGEEDKNTRWRRTLASIKYTLLI